MHTKGDNAVVDIARLEINAYPGKKQRNHLAGCRFVFYKNYSRVMRGTEVTTVHRDGKYCEGLMCWLRGVSPAIR